MRINGCSITTLHNQRHIMTSSFALNSYSLWLLDVFTLQLSIMCSWSLTPCLDCYYMHYFSSWDKFIFIMLLPCSVVLTGGPLRSPCVWSMKAKNSSPRPNKKKSLMMRNSPARLASSTTSMYRCCKICRR